MARVICLIANRQELGIKNISEKNVNNNLLFGVKYVLLFLGLEMPDAASRKKNDGQPPWSEGARVIHIFLGRVGGW